MPLSGQTHLPLNSPRQSEVSTMALQRPKKMGNSSYIASPSRMGPGFWVMTVRSETQTSGTLRIVMWLPMGAEDGGWPPRMSWAEGRLHPLGAAHVVLVSWSWHHVWQTPSWQS